MRRWIHNDTPCRDEEDGDFGFEVEVVSAKDYDRLADALRLIASYDKDSRHGAGTCPYGCDCPNIARNALANPSVHPSDGASPSVSGATRCSRPE